MAKPTGSKAASLFFYFLKANRIKMQRKDIAACHRTRLPKDYGIKTQNPPHLKPSFLFRFLLALAHAANAWSLSIFCCILFFITIKF